MRQFVFPSVLVPALVGAAFAAPAFEFHDGDRVAFLGDAFIEREQYEGWIELALTTRFPGNSVTFRNLGWNADLPTGDSRNGLSLLQAGLEPPEEGWRQLLNQLTTYKPNVIVLGYGMAASLSGGMSPEEFQAALERLLDSAPEAAGGPVRFLILGTPPRFEVPGHGADALENHRNSLAAINRALHETATKRNIPFVALNNLEQNPAFTQNGIHLTGEGYKAAARHIEKALGWEPGPWDQGEAAASLREHILKKNEWFFHRSRPANMAYIFGFRKGEQGNNAGEIPEFDKLVARQDEIIAKMRDLSKNVVIPQDPPRTESAYAEKVTQPHPEFTVADGYEITLWAENPLLHKPTQMNFDASGRLWVASSETYPQIEVGQTQNDKIIVLEDTDGDGTADKSTVFADGLLMPTGLLPGDGGVYVGQSTDLLHFKDTDGDGKGDQMTRVLSGFGTEDTHHNLHTLRRGPDGRIWMNQSIYTRTDSETPGGIFRLKSGGIMRLDPRNLDLETVFYGWCNAWGHQFDRYGQSFVTDGAGGQGINWGVPGAMYFTFARAPRTLASVSPGSYPKMTGIEIIESPHFPEDWQGTMITCDFRAHRIVRFAISDQGAGYITRELGDLIRTDHVSFRPIDIKQGPDGALYIADWANPIINHGEVDFRDPRRDRVHGRIWRVAKKGSPSAKSSDIAQLDGKELLDKLASSNRYEREQATTVVFESESPALDAAISEWKAKASGERALLAALWLSQGRNTPDFNLLGTVLAFEKGEVRAAGIRILGDWLHAPGAENSLEWLKSAIHDEYPRVRIEAIRVLAKLPGAEPMDIALGALGHPMDHFIDYALWLSVQEHGSEWLAALMDGKINAGEHAEALEFVLTNLPANEANDAIAKLLPKPLPEDGEGPWLDLALKTGNAGVIATIYNQVVSGGFNDPTTEKALNGISQAVSQRQIPLDGDRSELLPLFEKEEAIRIAAIRLAGTLQSEEALPKLIAIVSGETSTTDATGFTVIDALSNYQTPVAKTVLERLSGTEMEIGIRQNAALALARHHRAAALPLIAAVASEINESQQSRQFWQRLLSAQGISGELATAFQNTPLPAEAANLALQHIPDVPGHDELLKTLREQAGRDDIWTPERIQQMAADAAEKGDAARGELVYRRMSLACVACHAIGGAGGKVGPDMTSLGASAPLDYIIESVVLPGAKIKEGYHSVTIETKDGKAIMGQLVRSGGGSSVIRDAAGIDVTIPDNMIAKKTDAGSLMPGNLINGLPDNEVNDLFKFLSELGKPGAFDATKSKSPKVWAVLPLRTEIQEAAAQGDPSLPWIPIVGTVGGKLLPEDVKMMTGGHPGEIMIATKLQLAEPAKVTLEFPEGFKPTTVWIGGNPAPSGPADLEAGIHHIVIRCSPPGEALWIKSAEGIFLPEW